MQNNVEESHKVSIFIVTDGRYDCLAVTMHSLRNAIDFPFTQKFIVNDCVDPEFRNKLQELADYFGFSVIHHDQKKGFAGAYQTAFANVDKDASYCFILEDDFTFNERVDIKLMRGIIQHNPHLCQVALKRQAWADAEKEAGGICEMWPDLYNDRENDFGIQWTEHRNFFTTNPSLVPAWVIAKGWPLCPNSEKVFSNEIFESDHIYSSFLGKKFDRPKVTHIGEVRNGHGY